MELEKGWVKKLNDTESVMSEIKLHVISSVEKKYGTKSKRGFFPSFIRGVKVDNFAKVIRFFITYSISDKI